MRLISESAGTLFVVATPIGNLGDLSPRARDCLDTADIIACEDSRQTGKLLNLAGIAARGRCRSYHDHNARHVRPQIIKNLQEGDNVALVCDAGTPLISDPGQKLVAACHDTGLPVVSIPGPCAAISALSTSGLPTDRFLFAGFVPTGQAAATTAFTELSTIRATTIWYESPKRIAATLALMEEVFGPRPAAVARELTKLHEETIRATLPELRDHYADTARQRGECVILVEGQGDRTITDKDLEDLLRAALETGSVRDVVRTISETQGVSRRRVYELALKVQSQL